MKKAVGESGPQAGPEAVKDVDHSGEILGTMAKEPGDHLTCVHVFDNFYRCNWWATGVASPSERPTFTGLEVSTYRVRKSNFVRAAMRDGRLVVEDATLKA